MRIHKIHHCGKRIILEFSIAVQEYKISARTDLDGLITGFGNLNYPVANEPDLRKVSGNHFRTAVGRTITSPR